MNDFGRKLIDFCNAFECIILNGVLSLNCDGDLTFMPESGSSLVDYFICSRELISCVDNLTVIDMVESDHFPVELKLKSRAFTIDKKEKEEKVVTRIVWDKEKSDCFRLKFS